MEYLVSLKHISNINRLAGSFVTGIIIADDYFSSCNQGMSNDELSAAAEQIISSGLNVYVKVDRLYEEGELESLIGYLRFLEGLRVKAVIYTDVAVKMAIKLNGLNLQDIYAPETLLTNYRDIDLFRREHTSGCVISKDIPLSDIFDIIEKVPDYCYLRIHGPILIAYSRRRYISSYLETDEEYRNGYYLQELKRTNHLPIVEKRTGSWLYGDTLESVAQFAALRESSLAGMLIDNTIYDDEYTLQVVSIYQRLFDDQITASEAAGMLEALDENISYLSIDEVRKTILNKEDGSND